jgi:hypothetical protein
MIERNKRVDRGSLFSWSPEVTASVARLPRQDLKHMDLFAVGFAVSVTGDSQVPLHSGSCITRSTDVC